MGAAVGRSVLDELVGTVGMTAFQKLVEMPLTGRVDSYAPAALAEKVLRIQPSGAEVPPVSRTGR